MVLPSQATSQSHAASGNHRALSPRSRAPPTPTVLLQQQDWRTSDPAEPVSPAVASLASKHP